MHKVLQSKISGIEGIPNENTGEFLKKSGRRRSEVLLERCLMKILTHRRPFVQIKGKQEKPGFMEA
jgi:hypothetical protein